MKLEIELDLNKIDYDAINQQIQEKIADMNLAETWNFKYKIENKINEEVEQCVSEFFRSRRWGDLNNYSTNEMNQMLINKCKELIEPHVTETVSQIPEEELHKIISDLLPRVLMDTLSSTIGNVFSYYNYNSQDTTMKICEERIQNALGNLRTIY